jgi:hypothetical protein
MGRFGRRVVEVFGGIALLLFCYGFWVLVIADVID